MVYLSRFAHLCFAYREYATHFALKRGKILQLFFYYGEGVAIIFFFLTERKINVCGLIVLLELIDSLIKSRKRLTVLKHASRIVMIIDVWSLEFLQLQQGDFFFSDVKIFEASRGPNKSLRMQRSIALLLLN